MVLGLLAVLMWELGFFAFNCGGTSLSAIQNKQRKMSMARHFCNHYRVLSTIFLKVFALGPVSVFVTIWFLTPCAQQDEQANKPRDTSLSPQAVPAHGSAGTKVPVDLSTAIVQVAQRAIPAVVHIEVTQRQEVVTPLLPLENNSFFRHFFAIPKMPRKFRREL